MNYYKKAISYLSKKDFNSLAVCYEMAKNHPKFFVEAVSASLEGIPKIVLGIYKNAGKIEAIRKYRSLMGASLVDSKNFVEELCEGR